MYDPTDPIYSDAALHAYSHSQLKQLCINRGVEAKGNSNTLRSRLRALREPQPCRDSQEDVGSESFELVEDDAALQDADAAERGLGGGPSTASNSDAVADDRHGRDFAAHYQGPSCSDNQYLRSASWTDKLAQRAVKLFGGAAATTASFSQSHPTSSLASLSGLEHPSRTSDSRTETASMALPGSFDGRERRVRLSVEASLPTPPPTSASLQDEAHENEDHVMHLRAVPGGSTEPATAAYGNTTVELSFVPRRSFDDDSMALESVPVWPPRPGVILLSPLNAPTPMQATQSARKRRLDERGGIEEDGYDDANSSHCGPTIRLVRSESQEDFAGGDGQDRATKAGSRTPETAERRVLNLPKRYSEIARSPPRFDLEAPALPSIAAVLQPTQRSRTQPNSANKAHLLPATTPELNVTSAMPGALPHSDPANGAGHVQEPFAFGSPVKEAVEGLRRPSGPAPTLPLPPAPLSLAGGTESVAALQTVWNQLQARTGSMPASKSSSNLSRSFFQPAQGQPPIKRTNSVRFDDVHEKQFARSDSIMSHYAAKRNPVPTKKPRLASSSSNSSLSGRPDAAAPEKQDRGTVQSGTSSRQVSQSSIVAHPSGREAAGPVLATAAKAGPRPAKTPAQQKLEADRIKAYAYGSTVRGLPRSASPRKTNQRVLDSHRRVPIIPVKATTTSGQSTQLLPHIPSNSSLASRLFSGLKSKVSSGSLSGQAGSKGPEVLADVACSTSYTSSASVDSDQNHTAAKSSASYLRPTLSSMNRTNSIRSSTHHHPGPKSGSLGNLAKLAGDTLIISETQPRNAITTTPPHHSAETGSIDNSSKEEASRPIFRRPDSPDKPSYGRLPPLSPASSRHTQCHPLNGSPPRPQRPAGIVGRLNNSPAKRRIMAHKQAMLGGGNSSTGVGEDIAAARKIRARKDAAGTAPSRSGVMRSPQRI